MVQPPDPNAPAPVDHDDNAPLPPPSKPEEEQTTLVTAPRLPRDDDSEQTTAIGGVGGSYGERPFEGPGDPSFYDQPTRPPVDDPSNVEPTPTLTPSPESDEPDGTAVYLKQDGKVYMVRSWETLRQWIVEQRVSKEDLVSDGGVRWSPIGSRAEAEDAFREAEGPETAGDIPREQTSETFGAGPLPFDNESEKPFLADYEEHAPTTGSGGGFPRDDDTEGVPLDLPDMRFAIPPTRNTGSTGASISDSSDNTDADVPPPTSAAPELWEDPDAPSEAAPPELWEDPDAPSEPAPPELWDEDGEDSSAALVDHDDHDDHDADFASSDPADEELFEATVEDDDSEDDDLESESDPKLTAPPASNAPSYDAMFADASEGAEHTSGFSGEFFHDHHSSGPHSAAKARSRAMTWMLVAALIVTALVALGLLKLVLYPPTNDGGERRASASIGDALPPERPPAPPPEVTPAEETPKPSPRPRTTPPASNDGSPTTPEAATPPTDDGKPVDAEPATDGEEGNSTETPEDVEPPAEVVKIVAPPPKPEPPPLVASDRPPPNVTALVNRGWADLDAGNLASAENTLRIAAQRNPTSAEAQYAYGYALLQLDRLTEAATHICKARTLTPSINTEREVEGLIRRYEFVCPK